MKYRFNRITLEEEWTLKKVSWTKFFKVQSQYVFHLYNNNSLIATITVPEWFLTDFGSIPSIFFFFDKTRYISYILHDYLYSLLWNVVFKDKIRWVSRREADFILNLWLKSEWMNTIWTTIVDLWLLLWGYYNYKVHKLEIKNIISNFNINK